MNVDMPQTSARVPGLDLLRILSMIMVIVLHILGQGGILDAAAPRSAGLYAAWGLECLCYCAVDCYGLLSGYLGAGKRQPYSRLVLLWLEAELYSLLYYLFFRLRSPELLTTQHLIRALLPVLTRQYWYFTGYFGLMLLLPLFGNIGVKTDSPKATGGVFLLLVFFCTLPILLHTDAFYLRSGYCAFWLLLLYLMGALLQRSRFFHSLGAFPLTLVFLVCGGLSFYAQLRPVTVPNLGAFTLLSYTSPTVAFSAICLILLFRRVRFPEGCLAHGLRALSQTAFGVYIIHTNPLLWYWVFIPGCLGAWASLRARVLVLLVPACAFGVYLLCSVPACIRLLLFRRLRLRERLERLEEKLLQKSN